MDQDMLKQLVDAIRQIVDLLYQENIEAGYKALYIVLPYLERMIVETDNTEFQNELKEKLEEALHAMEDGDNILLADIMQYEVLEIIESYIEG
ncbi:MAG TPA: hypothetical protein DHV96_12140 [Lachnospiraceae bacterium]|nr:hypothetical protein [Lachnospiraceae bacterium]